ncbi:MAG: hypothetical protein L6416_11250 [Candidatus Omnitrophica bacterium]|nr:hypothetical protein [Candidatus Omnitrophota bacterium]
MEKLGSTFVGECVRAVSPAFEKSKVEEIADCETAHAEQVIKEISDKFYKEIENMK